MNRHSSQRARIARGLLLLACGAAAFNARATSQQEDTLFKAPQPHQIYDHGGAAVKVHRASLHGQLGDGAANAAALAELKQQVQHCVAIHQQDGAASNPPTIWPDFGMALREDVYQAANRSIRYSSGVSYFVRPEDCGLRGDIVAKAHLSSSEGSCDIDLVRKTARGLCDPSGHANAAIDPHGAETKAAALAKLAANPAYAAMAAQIQQAAAGQASKTGQQKAILGIHCDVWSIAASGEQLCVASGGSFQPAHSAGGQAWLGLPLEKASAHGQQMHAVDAMLDTVVNGAVFAPYNAGGYTFISTGSHK